MIYRHIIEAQRLIPEASEGARVFHEQNFLAKQWYIYCLMGYTSTMPHFFYEIHRIDYEEKIVQ